MSRIVAKILKVIDSVDQWVLQRKRSSDAPLDSMVRIKTPENISFEYGIAGPFLRGLVFLMDTVFFFGTCIVIWIVGAIIYGLLAWLTSSAGLAGALDSLGVVLWSFASLLFFLAYWFTFALFETYMNGQTPAKRLLKLRVLTIDGRPISGLQAATRNLLRFADGLPFVTSYVFVNWFPQSDFGGSDEFLQQSIPLFSTFLVGFTVMTFTSRFQRLGDLVCGTIVVREENHFMKGLEKYDDPRTPKLAEMLPPDFLVSRQMARALSAYVERRRTFSIERRREIARHLAEPLLKVFKLEPDTSYDLLLCALYYKTFHLEVLDEDELDGKRTEIENRVAV